VFPSVPFDSGSSKENPTTKTSAVAGTPITIQDVFIFCAMARTFVLNETRKQGIFASENEMSQTEATKNSIFNRFVTINLEEKDTNRSKMQAITEYLKDVKENAKEYNAALHVAGIFSFEEESPKIGFTPVLTALKDLQSSYKQTGWTFHNSPMSKNGLYCVLFLWKEWKRKD